MYGRSRDGARDVSRAPPLAIFGPFQGVLRLSWTCSHLQSSHAYRSPERVDAREKRREDAQDVRLVRITCRVSSAVSVSGAESEW